MPSVSANGRYVVFHSWASNLVSDDTNWYGDVFVYDRQTGQTTRVSVTSGGTQANNTSYVASISADGRCVAFQSFASNLVSGDTNGAVDVFVHDRETGETTRVSVASDGTQADGVSESASLSADGRYVAFYSTANNLVSGDTNDTWDVFVHDREMGRTERVSIASDEVQANDTSWQPVISADGRYVAFVSDASNLVSGDTNGVVDVFVHDRQTSQTERVSVGSDGMQGNGNSSAPAISAGGRYVAFVSGASNLVSGDTNGKGDIFVHDRETGETARISVTWDGAQGNGHSGSPVISAGGRYVAFVSDASNLVGGDTNGVADAFVYDRQTSQIARVSLSADGVQGNGESRHPSISADGNHVAYESDASNLVSDDSNGVTDVFICDRGYYSISGRVTDANNNPIPDATISDDAGHTVTTNSNGNYILSGLETGIYTLTPSKTDYVFSPDTRTVTVPLSKWAQDFTARPVRFTIILINRQKTAEYSGETEATRLMGKLDELASHPQVKGVVVQVESDPTVASAYAARTNPNDVNQAIAVADAIKQVIEQQLDVYASVEYLVIVGDDRIIPFYRTGDRTPTPDLCDSDGTQVRCTLTDDFYADRDPTPFSDRHLYIPDLAIGRLIETPQQMTDQIDTFQSDDLYGRDLLRGISTGYEFLNDSAQAQCDTMRNDGLYAHCNLIGDSWSKDDFRFWVLQTYHNIVSVNGHANPFVFGTPTSQIAADDFAHSPIVFRRAIFYTVGCHAGKSVPTRLDLAEAISIKRANYVANTGYGWGGGGVILSEELMTDFTQQLLRGTSTVLGKALVRAKQQYFADHPFPSNYDEKITSESTLYGLPMYHYATPGGLFSLAADDAGSNAPGTKAKPTGGLSVVSQSYAIEPGEPVSTPTGSYYTLSGMVAGEDGEPIEPRFSTHLGVAGQAAHGVVLTGGTYTSETADPAIQRVVTTLATTAPPEPTFTAPDWYPSIFFAFNRLEFADDTMETLVATAGQFNPNLTTNNRRVYSNLSFDIYYHDSSDDWMPPTISSMQSASNNGMAHITVNAIDASGIHAVVIAYTDGAGTWSSQAFAPGHCTEWTGSFPATSVTDFFVQAVDGAGNVTVIDKGDQYFHPGDFYYVAPSVEAGGDTILSEGDTFARGGCFRDPASTNWTATVDYGDGSGIQPLSLNPDKTFNLGHTYADDGVFVVTVTVSGDGGGVGTDVLVVTVANVAPVVDAGPDATVAEGHAFAGAGSFSDPGTADTWTATVDYGDRTDVQPLSLNPDKTFNLSHTYADDGIYIITVTVADDDGAVGTDILTVVVNNVAPELNATPATQEVQYSDPIADVTVTTTDVAADPLVASTSWSVGGGSFASGLPSGLALTDEGCTGSGNTNTCTWILSGIADMAADIYTVQVTIADDDGGQADVDITIVIEPEDAAVILDADNPVAVQVADPGGNSGPFSLTVYVREVQPDQPADSSAPGDIGLADVLMSLVPVGPGGPVVGMCVPGTVAGYGYDAVLPVTCGFDDVEVNAYTVQVEVSGGYYAGGAEHVLTVYDPSLGFATGGGWFYWPGTGERTNFGFTIKYNKKGRNVKGNLLLIRHLPDGTIFRVKSNALYGLALGDEGDFGWASFSGKSTYLKPGWPEPEGNYEFLVYVEDHDEPGTGVDRFWIEVKDKSREIVPAMSMGREATDNAAALEGGNITVPHAGGGN